MDMTFRIIKYLNTRNYTNMDTFHSSLEENYYKFVVNSPKEAFSLKSPPKNIHIIFFIRAEFTLQNLNSNNC